MFICCKKGKDTFIERLFPPSSDWIYGRDYADRERNRPRERERETARDRECVCVWERREETTSDCGIKQLPDPQRLKEDCVILRIIIPPPQLFIFDRSKCQHRKKTTPLLNMPITWDHIAWRRHWGKDRQVCPLFHPNSTAYSLPRAQLRNILIFGSLCFKMR